MSKTIIQLSGGALVSWFIYECTATSRDSLHSVNPTLIKSNISKHISWVLIYTLLIKKTDNRLALSVVCTFDASSLFVFLFSYFVYFHFELRSTAHELFIYKLICLYHLNLRIQMNIHTQTQVPTLFFVRVVCSQFAAFGCLSLFLTYRKCLHGASKCDWKRNKMCSLLSLVSCYSFSLRWELSSQFLATFFSPSKNLSRFFFISAHTKEFDVLFTHHFSLLAKLVYCVFGYLSLTMWK